MLLFQKALQVAVTHIAVLFTLGGVLITSCFSGNGLKVIDGRPAANPWVVGGLLLIEYAVPQIFKQLSDPGMVVYSGARTPVDLMRANQTLSLVLNAVDVAHFLPVIPPFAALVSASVSSSVSSVNTAFFSKDEPKKALLDTGRPRCSASGSKSTGLATNGNYTVNNVTGESSVFAGHLSATKSTLSLDWKAGYLADVSATKVAMVPVMLQPTVLVVAPTATLDATRFSFHEPNKALVDTGRLQCAASGFGKMGHETITGIPSGTSDQCYANQFFALFCAGTCASPMDSATAPPAPLLSVLSLASLSSSITSLDATLFCLNEPNKALSDSGRPRCTASGSKKKGQAANGNNARRGAARKSSGSSGRSSNSGGSSSLGSFSGSSSGGSAPPPPPPPPPGRSGGAPTRRSSRLQSSPAPYYALTTPRARRTLKVKDFEAPPDPPSGPPPPPPPSDPDSHGPYDVGDLLDPFTPWLRKIMIFIFCVFTACNMASKIMRLVPRSLILSQVSSLKAYFLRLEDVVSILMEQANDWFQLEGAPVPPFALHPPRGDLNPFPLFTDVVEGVHLRFPVPRDKVVEALVQAGLIERARGPLFGLRKYLSRLMIATIGVFAALHVLDIDWLRDMVETVIGVNKDADSLRADSDCNPSNRTFWLALGVEYEHGDSFLDESYLALPEANLGTEGEPNEETANIAEASKETSVVCALVFLAAYLLQQDLTARSEGGEIVADESLLLTQEEDLSGKSIQTEVEDASDLRLDNILMEESLEAGIQNYVEDDTAHSPTPLTVDVASGPTSHIDEDVTIQPAVGDKLALPSFLSQSSDHKEYPANSVATVDESIPDALPAALENGMTTSFSFPALTDTIEHTNTPEAATGSSSPVTDLSTPVVESERTGDAPTEALDSLAASASEPDSSIHTTAPESSTSSTTTPSDPRGPGIWSPPVTEINGATFVVIEGARRQRKRHRKAKTPANPVAAG
ncbi:hypothetical protein D9619_002451 [Psilocybe cf. subviscida]|uniref:Uncharacterized protein n=1 Tax=Psilocybe cf. subviscida TaxID=2480587 RepID=A0A8H5AWU9_9AGAR|nr:hypothetical protein D9619_002451 [Psilocybe cf. subviscida]